MRRALRRIYWICSVQFGVDALRAWRSLRGLPRYWRDLRHFRAGYGGRLEHVPCLHDWYEEGGSTHNEYFWQDLLVARQVFAAAPVRHVDVGSRVDGFVAHVASFRAIEVFDIRPTTAQIPGVIFRQWNAMDSADEYVAYCDSMSCLHALEHFGLGRYGDPVDPRGFERGIASMSRVIKPGGVFYLSVPVGQERVEFNANRVFDPRVMVALAARHGMVLETLLLVQPDGRYEEFTAAAAPLEQIAAQRYSLGIFLLRKQAG